MECMSEATTSNRPTAGVHAGADAGVHAGAVGMTDAGARAERRTQAERRAATRSALLDAAVESLIDAGYVGTTTRGIAARAGVSVGALQHHFASKAELVAAAVEHIRARMAAEVLAGGLPRTRSLRRRHEQLLDRMWHIYRGPLFGVFLELGVAARHDPELREQIATSGREMISWNERLGPLMFPEHADRPELLELITTGQAAMRGLALLGAAADALWPTTREHILEMNARVLDDPGLER